MPIFENTHLHLGFSGSVTVLVKGFTLKCIMFQNGQTDFKNLATFAVRF